MHAEIQGDELLIRIKLEKPHPSKSGKTLIVASTYGSVQTSAEIQGKPITVSLNAYIKK